MNTSPTGAEYFFLNVAVRTSEDHRKNCEKSQKQVLEQALAGLRFRDESYALLLTPIEAELYQLRIEPPKRGCTTRRLKTYRKVYDFHLNTDDKFNVAGFQDLMLDILSVMYRTAKLLRNEQFPNTST